MIGCTIDLVRVLEWFENYTGKALEAIREANAERDKAKDAMKSCRADRAELLASLKSLVAAIHADCQMDAVHSAEALLAKMEAAK